MAQADTAAQLRLGGRGVGVLRSADLRDGAELCVMTDKDNIAAAHVDSATSEGELVVTYRLWKGY
jgi:hypothetical protein